MFPKFSSEEVARLINKYSENLLLRDVPPPCLGWEAIYDGLLADLNEAMSRHEVELEITQIKVKFGFLRVYIGWRDDKCAITIPEEFYEIITKYENMSAKTCKICGKTKTKTVIESKITFECMNHYGDRRS